MKTSIFSALVISAALMGNTETVNAQDLTLNWAKQHGINGTNASRNKTIAFDAQGNVYTAGSFQGTGDFNPDPNATFSLTSKGGSNEDFYITKFDPSGNFIWAKQISSSAGTMDHLFCNGIAIDANNNIVLTGKYYGIVDFDPDAGVTQLASGFGFADAFVLKLNSDGGFIWAKTYGDDRTAMGNSIAVDTAANIYVAGFFDGKATFDGINQLSTHLFLSADGVTVNDHSQDAFVLKLDANGNTIWAKQYAGSGIYVGSTKIWYPFLSLDAANNVYIGGNYKGQFDFDPSPTATYTIVSNYGGGWAAPNDVFLSKLDTNGNFQWAKTIGGLADDNAYSMVNDANG
ncbi:MAG: hypothetical protein HOP02_00870, partial [Methylococcaceae bacterium]|nr:hypothetical protein [Methylococcaceae bacterium]